MKVTALQNISYHFKNGKPLPAWTGSLQSMVPMKIVLKRQIYHYVCLSTLRSELRKNEGDFSELFPTQNSSFVFLMVKLLVNNHYLLFGLW